MSSLKYSLDGAIFQEYTAPLLVDPTQTPVVYAFADDNVGNRSAPFELRLSSGLVAAYSFDEGSGTTVNDSSGYDNNGSIVGATWLSDGKFDNVLEFPNVLSRVTIPDADSLDLQDGMTLEAWVYRYYGDHYQPIIRKGINIDSVYNLAIDTDANEMPSASVKTEGGYSGILCDSFNLACHIGYDGEWTHVALTYNDDGLFFYVNGVPVGSDEYTGPINVSDALLYLGKFNGEGYEGNPGAFSGALDEVRIYNRALTQNEIQTDMNTPIGSGTTPTPTPVTPTPVTPTPVTPTPRLRTPPTTCCTRLSAMHPPTRDR